VDEGGQGGKPWIVKCWQVPQAPGIHRKVFEKSESGCKKGRQRNFIRKDPSAQYRTKPKPKVMENA